jgi:hypothetical protein
MLGQISNAVYVEGSSGDKRHAFKPLGDATSDLNVHVPIFIIAQKAPRPLAAGGVCGIESNLQFYKIKKGLAKCKALSSGVHLVDDGVAHVTERTVFSSRGC